MKRLHIHALITAALLLGAVIVPGIPTVHAAIACGDVILENTRLTSNLDCSGHDGNALTIGASKVTIDLNGYTILSDRPDHAAIHGSGFSRVTVTNGAIRGFEVGVLLLDASDSTIKRLSFMQQSSNSIAIGSSRGVRVSDIQASLEPLNVDGETVAVFLFDVDQAIVERVSADGGFYGLMSILGKKNRIEGNHFTRIAHVGIRLLGDDGSVVERNEVVGNPDFYLPCYSAIDVVAPPGSTRVEILGNRLTACGHGVFVVNNPSDPPTPPSSEISIRDNVITATTDGIRLIRVQDSELIDNRLHFNQAGIVLIEHSSDNRVIGNTATGNFDWDVFHDAFSTPNLWQDNTCVEAWGEDPDCP